MKFDVIIMNPPYQAQTKVKKQGFKGAGHDLWSKFIKKAFTILKEEGYLCSINPGSWRKVAGNFKKIKELLFSKQIEYLEIHDTKDGKKYFNALTHFDLYVVNNIKTYKETVIIDANYNKEIIDTRIVEFIPNINFKDVYRLCNNKENRVVFLKDRCAYDSSKLSSIKTEEYCYPCIYTFRGNKKVIKYSKYNNKGHFGIPKVIVTYGRNVEPYIDYNGEFGLTQYAFAIADKLENLENIKIALKNKYFIELNQCFSTIFNTYENYFIMLLQKNFWEEFQDDV